MRKLLLLASVAILGLPLWPVPASASTMTFHAETTVMQVTSLSFDSGVVGANCPAGFAERGGAFLTTQETVQVQSEVYSGALSSVSDQHCSVPRPPLATYADGTRQVTPIDLAAGRMVLGASTVGTLTIEYRAPGVIKGDLLGANTHTFHGSYAIIGGTGTFEGASGHGALAGEVTATATGFSGGWTMHGTISVPD